jgi:hypothetical protein
VLSSAVPPEANQNKRQSRPSSSSNPILFCSAGFAAVDFTGLLAKDAL